jgi:hypothetical protein
MTVGGKTLELRLKEAEVAIQYCHWALIALHRAIHPDCSKIRIELDLDRRLAFTSYTDKEGKDA